MTRNSTSREDGDHKDTKLSREEEVGYNLHCFGVAAFSIQDEHGENCRRVSELKLKKTLAAPNIPLICQFLTTHLKNASVSEKKNWLMV